MGEAAECLLALMDGEGADKQARTVGSLLLAEFLAIVRVNFGSKE